MNNEYSWDIDEADPTIINIFHNKTKVMKIYIGEAMEAIGRQRIMNIVDNCDNSPWLLYWKNGTLLCSAKEVK